MSEYTNKEREHALALLGKQFMSPEISLCAMWEVETREGRELVPVELVGDEKAHEHGAPTVEALRPYCESEPDAQPYLDAVPGVADAERVYGYFSRLSAAGYMDQTEWCGPFETQREAEDALLDLYVDPDDWEEIAKAIAKESDDTK